jgi:F420H(2)-dependent quinone reductase
VRAVRARVASDDERRRLWPVLTALYPGYEFFAQLAQDRTIPIVLLAPRA